jgi:Lipopolysaccharide-assembly
MAVRLATFLALVPLLFGCAYRLGPTGGFTAGEKSIQVMPFSNQTLEPRLTDAVTFQIHKQVQHDGTFRLATHDDGDIVVTGIITKYTRHELSFQPADTLTARDYRLSMTAQVTARDRITGKVIIDQEISGFTLLRVGPDLVSSERQSLPLLAGDLAKNVISRLADGTW